MLGMMIAASNAYLHGKNEAETAYRLITEGFVGTLKNWWDHLPKEAKAEIEASVRIDLSPGQPARDSEGQLIPNPVESLLATIRTHFSFLVPSSKDWNWSKKGQVAFDDLKEAMISDPEQTCSSRCNEAL